MSTRAQRDRARIRLLTQAINSLHCEIAHVVQAGENPAQLELYAQASFAKGTDPDGSLVGLGRSDLMELMGSVAAGEKLMEMGQALTEVQALIAAQTEDEDLRRDLLLYFDGIFLDRPLAAAKETFDAEA